MGTPMRQLILKIESRCNLSCDYCYVYESIDQSWRRQPTVMSPETVGHIARRIREHAAQQGIDGLEVVLHGGEPLLAGHEAVAATLATLRDALPGVQFLMQTNGILIDEEFLELFHRYGVRVGVSVDGGQEATDRHRRYANGRGSYDRIAAGIAKLMRPEHAAVYNGLLCTIDVRNDPVEVYQALLRFRPPKLDLLLPHGNWTNPPPQRDRPLRYAEWLVAVFDAWYDERPAPTRIRLFESIIARMFGLPSETEAIGGEALGIVTIETDGSYEQSDALKTTFAGGPATGLHVATHGFGDVLEHLTRVAPARLPSACEPCPVAAICGGGLRAHRYAEPAAHAEAGPAAGFDNPSVYSDDLRALITHITGRVRTDLTIGAVVA
ncbi:FxsB family cyclophane-forming radical SAM/SPASM peptide maturase [Dactylosporangium sp. NPDC051484]|uniref:FxsB family cyclophane-forming radical SAM/SPASM peptide maturase n=1 Tax=Dactylosporangium sp. NPDC051484 TaxID=3154942 RepID=UPI00344EC42E